MTQALEPIKYKKADIKARDLKAQVGNFRAEWSGYLSRAEADGAVNVTYKKEETIYHPTQINAMAAMENHPYLRECFAWSLFESRTMVMRPLPSIGTLLPPRSNVPFPHAIEDTDISYLSLCLSHCYEGTEFNVKKLGPLVDVMARQHDYNPIKLYLDSLTWDGTPRLDTWLTEALGAYDDDLTSAMGSKFLIGAVRRAIKTNGHKFDSMLILEGPKGIQKSSACRILFGNEYFMEGIDSIKSPKLVEKLSGIWGAEIPELKGFKNCSADEQKEFISKIADTYRVPYQTRAASFPRRCVFIGTVNDQEYLLEPETDRRFWPVKCNEKGPTNLQWLRDNRDQLWAEAYKLALTDTPDFMSKCQMQDMEVHQETRVIADPWEDRILSWMSTEAGKGMDEIRTTHVFDNVLEIPKERQDKALSTKVGQIMLRLGYKRHRGMVNGERFSVYKRGI